MTDDARPFDLIEAVRSLPRGAAVVVRARDSKDRSSLAKEIMRAARPRGVLTLIAADARLAIRLRADGVHCPEAEAGRVAAAKRALPKAIVTCAAHGREGLVRAARYGADAAILSPMFATRSHPGAAGLTSVRWALLRAGFPGHVIALGGVDADNAQRALSASANGIAVIGAWIAKT